MKRITIALVVAVSAVLLGGCNKDLSVLKSVKGSTFYVSKPEELEPLFGQAFDLFVAELKSAGSTQVEKSEEADFMLKTDQGILFVHRSEGVLWHTPWPNPDFVGFLENARDEATEFTKFLRQETEKKE